MLRHHGKGKTTALNIHGKYQIHTRYDDNVERLEEWIVSKKRKDGTKANNHVKNHAESFQLVIRKWKDSKLSLGHSNGQVWEYEIGSQMIDVKNPQNDNNMKSLRCSSTNPSFHAEDSLTCFIWNVQNCPWPRNNYTIAIDDENRFAVLRTKNKKYYKRFQIPAMSRLNQTLNEVEFKMKHDGKDVLTISYRKPESVLKWEEGESKLREEAICKLGKEGDYDCRQS